MKKLYLLMILLVLSAATLAGQSGELKMATTTSTENSGLLEVLIPSFEKLTGIKIKVIAVGTGKALALGRSGDVDLVLVHALKAEQLFVQQGYGVKRYNVMHNDFVIIGPADDPAGIKAQKSAARALKIIGAAESSFISRGDDSGTHKKEIELWQQTGISPNGKWYKEAGQGMGAVITMADALRAYTMTDRGTYLALQDKIELMVLVEGDPLLFNPYGIIAVNPEKHPHVNYDGSVRFIEWLTAPAGQKIIGSFRKKGEILFYPDAIE